MKKFFLLFLLIVPLISCSNFSKLSNNSKYVVDDKTYISKRFNERIQFIILHYTAGSNEASIKELTSDRVSSHYLILSGSDNKIYNLVPDNKRAWHAGVSSFRQKNNLNDISIGIEIVNEGVKKEYRNYEDFYLYEHYEDYETTQIDKVAQLILNLIEKYNIPRQNIIAHSDIAPLRKTDPGAKFPWKLLYEKYGIGAWYDEEDKNYFLNSINYSDISIQEIKKELRTYGYEINNNDEWDKDSQKVIYAFKLHFNPHNLNGEMDLETYAILKALNKKYRNITQ